MYNVNKNGYTAEESEILEPVHSCLRELLERERQGKSASVSFTDNDVIAITLLYSQIMGNRLMNKLTTEKSSIGLARDLSGHFGNMLNTLTFGMSGVDVTAYFKRKD